MGRHRRSEPAPVAPERRTAGGRHRSPHRRRGGTSVRTGLLGASAAMAMGAVAVASGLLPGPNGSYSIGGGLTGPSGSAPGNLADLQTQGAATPGPADRGGEPTAGRSGGRTASPGTGSPRGAVEESGAEPSGKPTGPAPSRSGGGSTPPSAEERKTPEAPAAEPPAPLRSEPASPSAPRQPAPAASPTTDAETAAEAEVLRLVNLERAEAGCKPLTADPELAELAGRFSRDMAAQGFFSHTDPDGDTPWDRAEAAGIENLAAENIARGQANAQSVMDAWMDSPGHRANILNCDYRTLGVGVHFAEGGPWWTQNFGF
ncbi:CAP domain-containing protein [Streptomyces desertarenae]|uniref:CAP domain-containing protein n=1 Tax=Streptomyces desertarenae TaxID=2666184 RepID=A0ABW4PNP7_9ACTN